MGHTRDYSEQVAAVVDDEVRRLVDYAHDEPWDILNTYREVLDSLVTELLERETLGQADLAEVFASVTKREPRDVWLSSPARPVSALPPVRTPNEKARGNGKPEFPQDEAAAARPEHTTGPAGEVPQAGGVDPGRLG
jgi:cell division protease FtsH